MVLAGSHPNVTCPCLGLCQPVRPEVVLRFLDRECAFL